MALIRRRNALRPRSTQGWDLDESEGVGSLFSDFDRIFNELAAPYMGQGQARWTQNYPVDLYETSEDIVLEMALPGVQIDDLDISIEGRSLAIRGTLPEDEVEDRRYWLQTIPRGEFNRTVNLPANVDLDSVHAKVEHGLLRLTMPKVAEAKARKITIDAS
jgi:HSP20 family protein